jgi:hypothetical protein
VYKLISAETMTLNSKVWKKGMNSWVEASKVDEFTVLFEEGPPPLDDEPPPIDR